MLQMPDAVDPSCDRVAGRPEIENAPLLQVRALSVSCASTRISAPETGVDVTRSMTRPESLPVASKSRSRVVVSLTVVSQPERKRAASLASTRSASLILVCQKDAS